MIVVDTNIISYLYLSGERSAQAEKALLKDPHWAAPLLWRSEFRNVLTLYLRKKLLSLDDAQQILGEAMNLMRDREYDVDSLQVLHLASECSCSAYDCEFVALATDLNIPLVTVDKLISSQFPDLAIPLEDFVAD